MLEGIVRERFRTVKLIALILVELLGEVVAVSDSEYSTIDIDVLSKVEILPGVVVIKRTRFRDSVTFQKDSLRDARVLNFLFNDVEGIVI